MTPRGRPGASYRVDLRRHSPRSSPQESDHIGSHNRRPKTSTTRGCNLIVHPEHHIQGALLSPLPRLKSAPNEPPSSAPSPRASRPHVVYMRSNTANTTSRIGSPTFSAILIPAPSAPEAIRTPAAAAFSAATAASSAVGGRATPMTISANCARASPEWPTSSNSCVASRAVASSRISSPPGWSSRKAVTSWTLPSISIHAEVRVVCSASSVVGISRRGGLVVMVATERERGWMESTRNKRPRSPSAGDASSLRP